VFKDIFKNDLGKYDPKAEQRGVKGVVSFLAGLLLSVVIPILFVYLEAWEITLQLERLIWDEDNFWRTGYFIIFVVANWAFGVVLMLPTYRINGQEHRLAYKKFARGAALVAYVVFIILYLYQIIK